MCPVEGERVVDLPDVITSAQTDNSENPSASPSLVYDNSPVILEEAMDTSEDQDNVLEQPGASSTVDQSLENSTLNAKALSENLSDLAERSADNHSTENVTEIRTENEGVDKSSEAEKESQSVVIAYQSNIEQSVEEKRAEHYSQESFKEDTNTVADRTVQQEQTSSQESKEVTDSSSTVEDLKGAAETNDNSEDLVEIPLDSENTGKNEEIVEESRTELLDNTGALSEGEVNLSDQNVNNNQSSESMGSTISTKAGHVHIHLDNTSDFDTFQFWRTPIPQLDLDLEIVDGKPQNIHVKARVKDEEHHKVYASEMNVQVSGERDVNSNLSDSMSDLTICDKLDNPVINTNRSESVSEEEGLLIHKASVSTVSETDNTFNSGVSTSVAGQNENTLTVIDGVVQGKVAASVYSECFVRHKI